jgi:hypothetical protein
LRQQIVEIESDFGDGLLHFVVDAEIDEIVSEVRTEQEFRRKISNGARTLPGISLRGAHPAMQQTVAHGVGQCQVIIFLGGKRGKFSLQVKQVVAKGSFERRLGQSCAIVFGGKRRQRTWNVLRQGWPQ